MSTENNNVITILTKNPLVIIVVAIVIVIIVLILNNNNNTPKPTTTKTNEGFSIENFPQSTPMNVMYSDASGNLGTTTDLGIEYLTVNGNSEVTGNSTVTGDSNLNGNVLSRDVFDGKGSQLKTDTILAGTDHGGRLHLLGDNVYVMAKNGLRIATDPNAKNPWGPANGNLTVDGNATVVGAVSAGSINTGGALSSAGRISGGSIYTAGSLSAESIKTASVNIYAYGDVKTKLDELFTKLNELFTKVTELEKYVKRKPEVRQVSTSPTFNNGGLLYLDRQDIKCNDDEYLSRWHHVNQGNQNGYFDYTCVKR